MDTIKINFAPIIGVPIILYTAHSLWGSTGVWLAIGMILLNATVSVTFRRKF